MDGGEGDKEEKVGKTEGGIERNGDRRGGWDVKVKVVIERNVPEGGIGIGR